MRHSNPKILSLLVTGAACAVPLSLNLGPASGAGTHARKGHRPAQPAPAQRSGAALHPVELPDGSGTMQLPPGWHITGANQGMVDAVGPQGMVNLGIWCPVYSPQAMMYGVRPPLVATYGDPARAVRELLPQFSASLRQVGQPGMRWIRLIEQTSTPWPQGKAAFLHYEYDLDGRGRWQTVAFVAMTPNMGGTWTYYASSVSAPSAQFARSLPVLLQVWSHWKVSDRVFQERFTHAMESMQETGRIIREVNARRQEAGDKSFRAGDLNVREHWVYEDTETGHRYESANDQISQRVEALNQAAGYQRYKIVSFDRLNR